MAKPTRDDADDVLDSDNDETAQNNGYAHYDRARGNYGVEYGAGALINDFVVVIIINKVIDAVGGGAIVVADITVIMNIASVVLTVRITSAIVINALSYARRRR